MLIFSHIASSLNNLKIENNALLEFALYFFNYTTAKISCSLVSGSGLNYFTFRKLI